ncbi:hypothetical protein MMC14_006068 [Varicellaria rhodocarpa]|nr:hypothetical protein [Varicellaria rhodocarpa]
MTTATHGPPLETRSVTTVTVSDLQKNTPLWYKLHVFIYDLRNYREIPEAQARLDSIVDASYMGLPYFEVDEVDVLKGIIVVSDDDDDDSTNTTLDSVIADT